MQLNKTMYKDLVDPLPKSYAPKKGEEMNRSIYSTMLYTRNPQQCCEVKGITQVSIYTGFSSENYAGHPKKSFLLSRCQVKSSTDGTPCSTSRHSLFYLPALLVLPPGILVLPLLVLPYHSLPAICSLDPNSVWN